MVGGPCSPNTLKIWLKKGCLVQSSLLPNLALTLCSPSTLISCGSTHTVPQGLSMCFPRLWTVPSTLVTELPLYQGLWIQTANLYQPHLQVHFWLTSNCSALSGWSCNSIFCKEDVVCWNKFFNDINSFVKECLSWISFSTNSLFFWAFWKSLKYSIKIKLYLYPIYLWNSFISIINIYIAHKIFFSESASFHDYILYIQTYIKFHHSIKTLSKTLIPKYPVLNLTWHLPS